MRYAVSSAQPFQLYRYSDVATRLDHELLAEARSLGACLQHFEATCREPGFALRASPLADALQAYARAAEPVDRWVHAVARGFEQADQPRRASLSCGWLRLASATSLRARSRPARHPLVRPNASRVRVSGKGPLTKPARVSLDRVSSTAPRCTPLRPKPTTWAPMCVWKPALVPKKVAPKKVLLQTAPEGDASVLNLVRYEKLDANQRGVFEYDSVARKYIRTVKDHLAAYGCLLTSYTMLLQSKGFDVSVTDLYKKNYELRTGRSFDEDARDGNIVLSDLYASSNLITRFTDGKLHERSVYTDREHAEENLRNALALHGPVIMHVQSPYGDGHWVVVDEYDAASGQFIIRDPLRGQVKARVPEDYKPKGEIRYLESSAPR